MLLTIAAIRRLKIHLAQRYSVESAIKLHKNFPHYYVIPVVSELNNLYEEKVVRLLIKDKKTGSTEKIWVRIIDLRNPSRIIGSLETVPVIMDYLHWGDEFIFSMKNIIEIT